MPPAHLAVVAALVGAKLALAARVAVGEAGSRIGAGQESSSKADALATTEFEPPLRRPGGPWDGLPEEDPLRAGAPWTSRAFPRDGEAADAWANIIKPTHHLPLVKASIEPIGQALGAGEKKKGFCPDTFEAVFVDMVHGDNAKFTIERDGVGHLLYIEPSGNDQRWAAAADLDVETCSATVDFRDDTLLNIRHSIGIATVTLWRSSSPMTHKTVFEVTDPTGVHGAKDFPLSRWVELKPASGKAFPAPCPTTLHDVFADMKDGDNKTIAISGTSMTITPSGNDQQWRVDAFFNRTSCSASVDFKVKGGPKLQAVLLHTVSAAGGEKTEVEFTDPSGKLAAADVPLNHWVQFAS